MDRNLTYVKNSNSFSVGSSSSSWLNKNNRIKIGVFIIFKDFIFLSQRATWNGLCKAPAQSCFFVDVDVDFFFFTRSPSLDYKKSLFLLLHLLAFCQPSSPTFSWHKMGRERNIIKRDRMCKLASSIFALIWKYLHFVLGVFGILWHASLSIERLGFTRHLDSRIFLSFFLFFISSTKYSEFHRSCL